MNDDFLKYKRKLNELIAKSIRFYRKKYDMSQKELARTMGVDQATVSRLEKETNEDYSLNVLCQVFDVFDMDVRIGFFDREKQDDKLDETSS